MKYSGQKALFNLMMNFYRITAESVDLVKVRRKMSYLVRKARKAISPEADQKTQVEQLLKLMYSEWGFCCDPERYFELNNLYLDQVLEQRRGMPVSLGAILLYLAESLNLPIYPVNFPTQLVLRVDIEEEIIFIDPWNGRILSPYTLTIWLEGYMGFGHQLTAKETAIGDPQKLAHRFNQLAKNTLMREGRNLEAFKFIEYLRQYDPQDPYEIRDRGLVLANLECVQAAVHDFDYFIEKCPEDPTAWLLAAQLPILKEISYPIH